MFGLQAPTIKSRIAGVQSFQQLGAVLSDLLGNCEAHYEHNGPVKFTGPVEFSGPVENDGGDPLKSERPVRGVLIDDLLRDQFARMQIVNGPVVLVFGYLVKGGSPTQKVAAGSRVVAEKCWGDNFFTAISGDNCTEDV